jgi:hypothetical protein
VKSEIINFTYIYKKDVSIQVIVCYMTMRPKH